MGKNYFDTQPVPAASVRTNTGLPAQHAEQKRRTILPVVAFGALLTFLFIVVFGLGFYVGTELAQAAPDDKQAGQIFEKTSPKLAGPVFEKTWHSGYAPCAAEDSLACYWDASTMGNGLGRSFLIDDAGNVTYITPEELP